MIVYKNPWFQVINEGNYHYVEEPLARGAAAILPRLGDSFLLLTQHRPAQRGECTVEIPRGYAEPGESAAQCATRELAEETGIAIAPDQLERLGKFRPNTAILTARVDIFLATLPCDTPISVCEQEASGFTLLPIDELAEVLASGRIEDGFSLAAFAFYLARHGTSDGVG